MFFPFGNVPEHEAPPRDEDWRALAAALRPVSEVVARLAERELAAAAWRPGMALEHVAWAEGRRDLWRKILAEMRKEG